MKMGRNSFILVHRTSRKPWWWWLKPEAPLKEDRYGYPPPLGMGIWIWEFFLILEDCRLDPELTGYCTPHRFYILTYSVLLRAIAMRARREGEFM